EQPFSPGAASEMSSLPSSESNEKIAAASSKPEPVYAAAMREILNWLCRSRVRLAVIYLSGLLMWIGLSLYSAHALFAPELLSPLERKGANEELGIWTKLIWFAVFFALQAGFLFGGGKLRVLPGPTRWYRRIVSLLIFSTLMAILCWGFVLTYLELTARMSLSAKADSSILLEITIA